MGDGKGRAGLRPGICNGPFGSNAEQLPLLDGTRNAFGRSTLVLGTDPGPVETLDLGGARAGGRGADDGGDVRDGPLHRPRAPGRPQAVPTLFQGHSWLCCPSSLPYLAPSLRKGRLTGIGATSGKSSNLHLLFYELPIGAAEKLGPPVGGRVEFPIEGFPVQEADGLK